MEAGTFVIWGLILVGVVVLFLAVREIMTWYWKIDTILKYQHEQSELLKQILSELRKKSDTRIPAGSEIDL